MKKVEYNYWLSNIDNIGAVKIEKLLQLFGNAESIFRASRNELKNVMGRMRLSDEDINRIIQSRNQEKVCENYAKLKSKGIYFVSKEDDNYPNKLKQIYGAPFALYGKGARLKEESRVLAIVGARNCSLYGKEMARYLAGEVAKAGIIIISGLARGIDSYAHIGALEVGGTTFGVLGCGIDICYPKENIKLFTNIQAKGSVLSEYAPGVQPYAGNFPMRNRIISGLSDGILVIEAKEKSGSLITVDIGLDQGKDIYAMPGRATDCLSAGCNNLIKMGAKLVTTPKDILEEMLPNYEQNMDEMKKFNNLLESQEKIVYACLSLEPKHIEEIAALTHLPMDLLMEQLLHLELKGLALQTIKNYYIAQQW